ncbi:MAG: hypothetical protein JKY27_13735, partial [Magnetovibrio sp.]|nr:hypothetical protein [Magnetovibrio sp.]
SCPSEGCFIAALDDITRFTTGGFGEGLAGLHTGLIAIVIIGAVLWLMMVGQGRAYLYAAIFIGTPLIYLALGQPNVPYGRYFIGIFAFLPLIIADVMGEIRARSKPGHLLMAMALLALISANTWSLTQFQRSGRGQYSEAFNFIINNSPAGPLTIGSDMTFRLAMIFDHLAQKTARTIHYIQPQNVSNKKPAWLVTVLVKPEKMVDSICLDTKEGAHPVVYRLAGVYPYWGLSGTPWGVYRLVDMAWTKCP